MKVIFKIGRHELLSLFYSPVAWLLLIVITIQSALSMMPILDQLQRSVAGGLQRNDLTKIVFFNYGGLFYNVQQYLYLYVPLLTMGLMSRELHSGSIKLLLSSPVKSREIVLGKYTAIMFYWMIIMLILMLFVLACYLFLPVMDIKFLITGIIGLYLLACAYSAIGLFMSCLTQYQVIAGISTLIVLAILNYIGGMWQDIPVARDVAYFLDIKRHISHMMNGLVVSKDIIYFIILVVMFLGLSIIYLRSNRESTSNLFKATRYFIFISCLLLIGYFSAKPAYCFYADMTSNQANTITVESQEIIKQFEEPVTITAYVNLLDENVHIGMPGYQNSDKAFWEKYIRFMPNLKLQYVNFYDTTTNDYIFRNKLFKGKTLTEIAEHIADGRDWDLTRHLPPSKIRKKIDLSKEDNSFVRQLEYKGKTVLLRNFDDIIQDPTEKEIATAFKRLLVHAPKIGFLTGHLERNIYKDAERDYRIFTTKPDKRSALINQGFEVKEIDLEAGIPADITAIVIADPVEPFTNEELSKISKYISTGGNLLICAEPGRQEILNVLINELGVHFENGTLLQNKPDNPQDIITAEYVNKPGVNSRGLNQFFQGESVSLPGAVAIREINIRPFKVTPVLSTRENLTWNKYGTFKLDTGVVLMNEKDGDMQGEFVTALALTRQNANKEQKIMLVGDADFMSNKYISSGQGFATSIFKWFNHGEFPLEIKTKEGTDNKLILTQHRIDLFKVSFLWLLPGLLFIAAAVLLLMRRRK